MNEFAGFFTAFLRFFKSQHIFSEWQPIWKERIFTGKYYITIARSYYMIGSDRTFLSFFREIISATVQTVFPPIQL